MSVSKKTKTKSEIVAWRVSCEDVVSITFARNRSAAKLKKADMNGHCMKKTKIIERRRLVGTENCPAQPSLLPCPLCGGEPIDLGLGISCATCGIWLVNDGTHAMERGGYRANWNTRTTSRVGSNADELDSDTLAIALGESIKLQAHYAKLLNMHDGGERMIFSNVADWIARLRETGTIK